MHPYTHPSLHLPSIPPVLSIISVHAHICPSSPSTHTSVPSIYPFHSYPCVPSIHASSHLFHTCIHSCLHSFHPYIPFIIAIHSLIHLSIHLPTHSFHSSIYPSIHPFIQPSVQPFHSFSPHNLSINLNFNEICYLLGTMTSFG